MNAEGKTPGAFPPGAARVPTPTSDDAGSPKHILPADTPTTTGEARIAALFTGLDRAHGVAVPSDRKDARGKVGARYVTKRTAPSDDDWRRHLLGEHCLVPIPIRDDGTAGFGAIDVDVYPLDLVALDAKVRSLNLPLVVCRSKSGGAHLFLFLTHPVPAERVQQALRRWATGLGYPNAEVFPKQVNLASDRDTGNGIAAPYHGAAAGPTVRYAIGPTGQPMTLREFLDVAEAIRAQGDDLDRVTAEPPGLEGAPPCLQQWARVGVPSGQRNDVMFDFAVYARTRWGEEGNGTWRTKADYINRRHFKPPLSTDEMTALFKSVGKKDYSYKAKCRGPYCDPTLCGRAEFGRAALSDAGPGAEIERIRIEMTEPERTYHVTIGGREFPCTAGDLLSARRFEIRSMEAIQRVVSLPKSKDGWKKRLNKLLETAERIDVPEDAGPQGQLRELLRDFFDRHVALERDRLALEHCWYDGEAWMYFRSKDFMDFLRRMRAGNYAGKTVYSMVRGMGGGSYVLKVKGEPLRCWRVPWSQVEDSEPLSVPEIPPKSDAPF